MSDGIKSEPISGNEGGVIARLWRNTLKDLGYSNSMPQLVQMYLNRHGNKNSPNVVKMKAKSSIANDIASGDMTFKVLYHLLFYVLDARKATLTLTIEHGDGSETIHHTKFAPPQDEKEDDGK